MSREAAAREAEQQQAAARAAELVAAAKAVKTEARRGATRRTCGGQGSRGGSPGGGHEGSRGRCGGDGVFVGIAWLCEFREWCFSAESLQIPPGLWHVCGLIPSGAARR